MRLGEPGALGEPELNINLETFRDVCIYQEKLESMIYDPKLNKMKYSKLREKWTNKQILVFTCTNKMIQIA